MSSVSTATTVAWARYGRTTQLHNLFSALHYVLSVQLKSESFCSFFFSFHPPPASEGGRLSLAVCHQKMALQPSHHATLPPIPAASSGCQREKCKCICFTQALRAFSACVQRPDAVCDTEREYQYPICSQDSGRRLRVLQAQSGDSPFRVAPYSNYTLVALKSTNDHGLGDKEKLNIFVVSPSLYSSYSGYELSGAARILFTITSAYL